MSLENGKCPSCGGALLLDSSKEKAICKYCGHEVIIQQAVQKVKVDGIADFDTIMLSAQRALELDNDFDKAAKKYKEALNLSPDDYRALWGLYVCEMAGLKWAKVYKGYYQYPGDILTNFSSITTKYGERAYSLAPEETKPYYYREMQGMKNYFVASDVDTTKKGCYVATCVYGSYDCPQVWTLRRFRDDKLAKTWSGRAFIRTYYAISPTLVKWFGKTKWFKRLWKGKLNKMVSKLQEQGFKDTPYEDKNW